MRKVFSVFAIGLLFTLFIESCNQRKPQKVTDEPIHNQSEAQLEEQKPVNSQSDTANTNPYWMGMARYLAGLPANEPIFDSLQKLPDAVVHQKYFDNAFLQKETVLLDKLGAFAQQELGKARENSEQTVFYPFSGADFVTIHTLYPNAKRYVLFGLEPEGVIPHIETLSPVRRAANLQNIRVSSDDIMSFSFFKTIDMAADFRRFELKGTLPLLLAFIARTGNDVLSVNHIQVDESGKIFMDGDSLIKNPNLQSPTNAKTGGYRIKFKNSEAKELQIQTLDYFSVDVLNEKLKKNPNFLEMLSDLSPCVTYIKSASYLLHKNYFSVIGDKIKEVSDLILQDDSGFPIRAFDENAWHLTYYGKYMKPIPLFSNLYQPDLMKKYTENEKEVVPLAFGIGYRYQHGTSNLLRARKLSQGIDKNDNVKGEESKSPQKGLTENSLQSGHSTEKKFETNQNNHGRRKLEKD